MVVGRETKDDEKSDWDQKYEAIENAFRALPIKDFSKAGGIPYEFLIPGMGRQLMLMTPISGPQTLSPKEALSNVRKSLVRVIRDLDNLPPELIRQLPKTPRPLWLITSSLKILLEHVLPKELENSQIGPPIKTQAAQIAKVVALHYYGLTGKKPTVPKRDDKAYGPFLGLLKEVFDILGVKASAVSQAEKISRNWKSVAVELLGP